MEAWVGVAFGVMAGYAVARLHHWFDGGWWVSVPLGALGGVMGRALWTDSLAARLDDSTLAGTAVAGLIGGAILGALSGLLRFWLVPRLIARLRATPTSPD